MYVIVIEQCMCESRLDLPVGKGLSSSSAMVGIPFHIVSWMQTEPKLQDYQDQEMHTWMEMYSVNYAYAWVEHLHRAHVLGMYGCAYVYKYMYAKNQYVLMHIHA